MFEMATGNFLSGLSPSRSDYRSIKDESVKEIIRFIFGLKSRKIKKVSAACKPTVGYGCGGSMQFTVGGVGGCQL